MKGIYKISNEYFINPYNFVPVNLERKETIQTSDKDNKVYTGYFTCRLKCRTPLAIPDVENRFPLKIIDKSEDKIHYGYPFLGMKQEMPRIPGSSLRGVIRNVYEAITDSCFGTMKEENIKKKIKKLENTGLEAMMQCNTQRINHCPACSLFGTAENEGRGSRIRFTDAKCTNYDKSRIRKDVTFRELASPNIKYIPFYLCGENYSKGYDSDSGVLEIRGRKYYWHHNPINDDKIECNDRNATFDVISTDTEFEFRIYFDGITEKQIKLLSTSIHMGENDIDGKICHKLGHGKPLGYGSVKITIIDCVKRVFDKKDGWEILPVDESLYSFKMYLCNQDTWDSLMAICDLNKLAKLKENVEYPRIIADEMTTEVLSMAKDKNSMAGHQWFNHNYKKGNEKPEQLFPKVLEEQKLAHYELSLFKGIVKEYQENRIRVNLDDGIEGYVDTSGMDTEIFNYITNAFRVGKKIEISIVENNENECLLHIPIVEEMLSGGVLDATVKKITPRAVSVDIGSGLSGRVHISQICEKWLNHPEDVLSEGDKVKVKMINIRDGKINFSMKGLNNLIMKNTEKNGIQISAGKGLSRSMKSLLENVKIID